MDEIKSRLDGGSAALAAGEHQSGLLPDVVALCSCVISCQVSEVTSCWMLLDEVMKPTRMESSARWETWKPDVRMKLKQKDHQRSGKQTSAFLTINLFSTLVVLLH